MPDEGEFQFNYAIQSRQWDILLNLIRNKAVPVDTFTWRTREQSPSTALMCAITMNAPSHVIVSLINLTERFKADINQTNPDGDNALSVAAKNDLASCIVALLKHGAFSISCIFDAVNKENISALTVLLRGVHNVPSSKFDVNSTDSFGRTPLHYACMYGYSDVCRLLLEFGADPLKRDTDRKSSVDYADEIAASNIDKTDVRRFIYDVIESHNLNPYQ